MFGTVCSFITSVVNTIAGNVIEAYSSTCLVALDVGGNICLSLSRLVRERTIMSKETVLDVLADV